MLIPNSYVIYLCDLLFLALIPIPILLLLKETAAARFHKLIGLGIGMLFFNFFIQIILNFAQVCDLREMVLATHILALLVIALFVFCLFVKPDKKQPQTRRLRMAVLPIIIGAMIDLVLFYIPSFIAENSVFFQLGVLAFVIIQMVYVVRSYLNLSLQTVKAHYFERMAYTDVLTGIGNRAAFEKRLETLEKNSVEGGSLWCVSADINNLKAVNDTFGHSMGDTIIQETARILKSSAPDVYRTGGDEFIIFVDQAAEEELNAVLRAISDGVDAYNASQTVRLNVGV